MSIVTKTGDKGQTGLFGGKRIAKNAVRIHAYGTVDELNAVLGVILAEEDLHEDLRTQLLETQRLLFRVGGDLATPHFTLGATRGRPNLETKFTRVESDHILQLEHWINDLEGNLPVLKRFILPSGSRLGSLLHFARTVCRRAERWVVDLGSQEQVNPNVQIYLNRLSDYLFLAARKANREQGATEIEV